MQHEIFDDEDFKKQPLDVRFKVAANYFASEIQDEEFDNLMKPSGEVNLSYNEDQQTGFEDRNMTPTGQTSMQPVMVEDVETKMRIKKNFFDKVVNPTEEELKSIAPIEQLSSGTLSVADNILHTITDESKWGLLADARDYLSNKIQELPTGTHTIQYNEDQPVGFEDVQQTPQGQTEFIEDKNTDYSYTAGKVLPYVGGGIATAPIKGLAPSLLTDSGISASISFLENFKKQDGLKQIVTDVAIDTGVNLLTFGTFKALAKGNIKNGDYDRAAQQLFGKNVDQLDPEELSKFKELEQKSKLKVAEETAKLDDNQKAAIEEAANYFDNMAKESEKKVGELGGQNIVETSGTGQGTQEFFGNVAEGNNEVFKPAKPFDYDTQFTDPTTARVKESMDSMKGQFDEHIATSIPTFRDTQVEKGSAIVKTYPDGASMIDLGGSEGGFVKAITKESGGKIRTTNLDASSVMMNKHMASGVDGSAFEHGAFKQGWEAVPTFTPKEKYDVVHESMMFQFIEDGGERASKIDEVADKYLKEDGLFITEEKFKLNDDAVYKQNEKLKENHKNKYYTKEQQNAKTEEVLIGMSEHQANYDQYLDDLHKRFDYVGTYWTSGNFRGIVASNSQEKFNKFMSNFEAPAAAKQYTYKKEYMADDIVEGASAADYAAAMRKARIELRDKADLVTPVSEAEAQKIIDEGGTLFTTKDGKAGAYVTGDGYMGGLFRNPTSDGKAAAKILQEARIKHGGKLFDSFANNEELYIRNGWKPVARMKFNPEYAPAGWEKNKELQGRPDNVFFVYDPKGSQKAGNGAYFDDYDEAYAFTLNYGKSGSNAKEIAAAERVLAFGSKDLGGALGGLTLNEAAMMYDEQFLGRELTAQEKWARRVLSAAGGAYAGRKFGGTKNSTNMFVGAKPKQKKNIMYHGTTNPKADIHDDMFFTNKPEYAEQYAGKDSRYYPYRKDANGKQGVKEEYFMQGGRTIQAEVDIENPMTVTKAQTKHDPEIEKKLIAAAKKKGHDGLRIVYEGTDRVDTIAFNKNKIRPTFDRNEYEQGAFSNIHDRKVRRWIDDSKAEIGNRHRTPETLLPKINDVRTRKALQDWADGKIKNVETVDKKIDPYWDKLEADYRAAIKNDDPALDAINEELDALRWLYNKNFVEGRFELDQTFDLSSVLKHDDLYKQYPELKKFGKLQITFTDLKDGVKGVFDGRNQIKISSEYVNDPDKIKSIILHEVQHKIQAKEGWARGGSPEEFSDRPLYIYTQRRNNKIKSLEEWTDVKEWNLFKQGKIKFEDIEYPLRKELDDGKAVTRSEYVTTMLKNEQDLGNFANYKNNPEAAVKNAEEKIKQYRKEIDDFIKNEPLPESAFSQYERLAGEQEARATQAALEYPDLEPYAALRKKEKRLPEPIVKMDEAAAGSMSREKPMYDGDASLPTVKGLKEIKKIDGFSSQGFKQPLHLPNGDRISGYNDAERSVLYGYDKNGEAFTIGRQELDDQFRNGTGIFKDAGETGIKIQSNPVEALRFIAEEIPLSVMNGFDWTVRKIQKALLKGKTIDEVLGDMLKAESDNELIDTIKKAVVQDYRLSDQYLALADQAQIAIKKGEAEAHKIFEMLKDIPEDDLTKVHDFVAGETNAIPEAYSALAQAAKRAIKAKTHELVSLGLLPEDILRAYQDGYVHREYAKHIKRAVADMFFNNQKKLAAGYKRGKTETISSADYDALVEAGEVGDSIRTHKYVFEGRTPTGKVKVRRDWTKAEREEMGEVTNAAFTVPNTIVKLQRDIAYGNFLSQVATDPALRDSVKTADDLAEYLGVASAKDIPESGTGFVKLSGRQFGKLDGMYVEEAVANDIKGFKSSLFGDDRQVFEAWKTFLGEWKVAKTIKNPTAHMNNFLSNAVMSYYAGIKPSDVGKNMTGAINQIRTKGQYFKEAEEVGLFGRSKLEDIRRLVDVPTQKVRGAASKVARNVYLSEDSKLGSVAFKLYELEDDVARLSLFMHYRKQGMTQREAMKAAGQVVFDYTKRMPPLLRGLRDSGLVPFVSWTYKSLPLMFNTLFQRPSRYAAAVGAYVLVDEMINGDSEKPEFMRGKYITINRSGKESQQLRIASMTPYFDWFTEPTEALKQQMIGGVPLKPVEFATGRQLWNDQKITYRDGGEAVLDYGLWTANNVLPTPAYLSKVYNVGEAILNDGRQPKRNKLFKPRSTAEAAAGLFGFNVRTYDQAEQRKRDREKARKELKKK